MKVCLISDTHDEFNWSARYGHDLLDDLLPEEDEFDVLVAAGDINSEDKGAKFLLKKYTNKPVIYVPGNHEYYGTQVEKLNAKFRDLAEEYENFIFMPDGQIFSYHGVDFFGGTNWPAVPKEYQIEVKYNIADYTYIGKHKVEDHTLKNVFDANLKELVDKSTRNRKRIGVSHFLPDFGTVSDKWSGPEHARLNNYFVSPIDREVLMKFHYWLFGHTHCKVSKQIYNCKFLCNPRGYPNENSGKWAPLMININI